VLDLAGEPIAGAYVAAVASEFQERGQRTDWVSARSDDAGRFELRGLSPDVRHCLLAGADRLATVLLDFPADELEGFDVELGDVLLPPPAILAGTVQDENGEAVTDVRVTLTGANADRGRLRDGADVEPSGGHYVEEREGRADAQGRFRFGSLPAGNYTLRASRRGSAAGASVRVAVAEGRIQDDLVLLYPRGESIRGTVVDDAGAGLGGVWIAARLKEPRSGDVDPRSTNASARTEPDGTFALEGLPAGTWHLTFIPVQVATDPDAPFIQQELEAVESAVEGEPLRVILPRGASIQGRLVDTSGAALVGYAVVAQDPVAKAATWGSSQADGSFLLEVAPGTVWTLEVRGSVQTEARDTVFHTIENVAAGTRDLVIEVER